MKTRRGPATIEIAQITSRGVSVIRVSVKTNCQDVLLQQRHQWQNFKSVSLWSWMNGAFMVARAKSVLCFQVEGSVDDVYHRALLLGRSYRSTSRVKV